MNIFHYFVIVATCFVALVIGLSILNDYKPLSQIDKKKGRLSILCGLLLCLVPIVNVAGIFAFYGYLMYLMVCSHYFPTDQDTEQTPSHKQVVARFACGDLVFPENAKAGSEPWVVWGTFYDKTCDTNMVVCNRFNRNGRMTHEIVREDTLTKAPIQTPANQWKSR